MLDMVMNIVFHNREKGWSRIGRTSLLGTILEGDRELTLEELDKRLAGNVTAEALASSFADINGFYSFVHLGDDRILLAMDRIRSFPLFYGTDGKVLYTSDDPFWIVDKLGDRNLDETAKREFSLSGYVTRDRTLSPRVKQVRAGEMVLLSLYQGNLVAEVIPYQKYKPGDFVERDLESSLKELDRIMVASFRRMIEQAKGRTIAVPLSGGYDSRLIVLMLKKLGYDNVLAFSYGRPDNPESKISKEVAAHLGIRWEFVEYSNESWLKWYESEECRSYYPMGSRMSSLPHLQDWPALKVLKDSGRLPQDAIFAPGHTICNPSQYANLQRHSVKEAERLPKYQIATVDGPQDAEVGFPLDRLVNDLVTDNYNLPGRPIKDPAVLLEMRKLVLNGLDNVSGYDDYVSAYEYWNFNERQVKFIFNSIRIYDYWGHLWWMPLLDKELMDFWRTLSIDQRYDKYLVRVYTDRLSAELMKDFHITHYQRTLQKKGFNQAVAVVLKNRRISNFMGVFYSRMRKSRMYDTEPQAYFGMLTKERYKREYTGREYINYFTAADYIEWVSKELAKAPTPSPPAQPLA